MALVGKQIPVEPGKKDVPVVATDPHRRAAEMVLKYGGTVAVRTANGSKNVTRREDLPAEPLILMQVLCVNRQIPARR